jgi:hypothetical protein
VPREDTADVIGFTLHSAESEYWTQFSNLVSGQAYLTQFNFRTSLLVSNFVSLQLTGLNSVSGQVCWTQFSFRTSLFDSV